MFQLLLKDRARVHPFAGNGGSWRKVDIRQNGPWSVARSGVGRSTGNPAFEECNLLLGPCAIAWHRAGT